MTAFNNLRAALADALEPLTHFNQFVVYRLAEGDDGTLDKIPVNPTTLHNGSAQDYANWMDAHTAIACADYHNQRVGWNAYGVGFALTQAAGFWCVDVDSCVAQDGSLTPLAVEACNAFPGAAIERSVSGRGIHIWGRGEVPTHASKYGDARGKLELYTSHRFIALCGDGACGYAGNDFTETITAYAQHYFPPKAEDTLVLSDGPCAEWSGPRDDGELVAAALLAEPAQVIPHDSNLVPDVSFGDLWTRNVEVLRRRYPPNKEGQQFDASDADLALARKLAYWTGRDVARTERLMHMSGLAREKWQRRRGWITETIIRAAKKVTQVYGEDNAFSKLSKDEQDFRMQQAHRFVELLKAQKEQRAQERFQLLSCGELLNQPPQRMLVRGVLPAEGLAAMYGPSGSGKSFMAIDVAVAAASPDITEWFGKRIGTVPVTYLALEGGRGVGKRLKAWQQTHKRALPSQLKFIDAAFDMTGKSQDVSDLSTVMQRAGMVNGLTIIDTLSRAAPGADENSSQDMGAIIAKAAALQRAVGGLVLIVHHTGKDGTKGLRGHSSLYAALDAAIEVQRDADGNGRSWSIAKAKDDADGRSTPFELSVVKVGESEDGPVTSCVVKRAPYGEGEQRTNMKRAANEKKPEERLKDRPKIALDVIRELIRATPDNTVHPENPCVHWTAYETAIRKQFSALGVESRHMSTRISEALTALVRNGLIAQHWVSEQERYYFIPSHKHDEQLHRMPLTS